MKTNLSLGDILIVGDGETVMRKEVIVMADEEEAITNFLTHIENKLYEDDMVNITKSEPDIELKGFLASPQDLIMMEVAQVMRFFNGNGDYLLGD